MSTYKQIAGTTVKAYTTNPSDPQEGEMWYNQTTLKLRGVTALAAWSSASNLTQIQRDSAYGQSTPSTASWFAGGTSDPTRNVTTTQEFNGSGWSNGGSLNTGREEVNGFGLVSAGLAAGGATYPPAALKNEVEEYDGSSWTAATALPAKRKQSAGIGTQTAGAICFGRVEPPTTAGSNSATTLEYDGSSWTSGGTGNTARGQVSSAGTLTAGVVFSGESGPTTRTGATEEYDGTSWTTSGSMNDARTLCAGNGIQTSALAYGGFTPYSNKTESYDGSTWTSQPNLATARDRANGGGPDSTYGICAGGLTSPGGVSIVEEYNFSAQVVTAAAWSSGGNLGTTRQRAGGFGNAQNSAVVAAGATAPPASALSATEEYDGSAWSASGSVNTARFNMTAFGTETAGVLSGKGTPSVPYGGTTEEYDGSTWTTVNPYAAPGANYRSSCGPQTAGLLAGGVAPAPAEMTNAVEEYDGTNWTSGTTLPQYQSFNLQAGTQTAAINGAGAAGPAAPGPVSDNSISLEYDGTNWTSGPNANILPTQVRSYNGGTGTQTAAMFVGGETNTQSVRWDGTTFATDASYPTARGETSAAGLAPAPNAILFAGYDTTALNTTVEYSEESTSTNSVDITTAE